MSLKNSKGEKVFNICVGLSLLSWALLGLRAEEHLSIARLCIMSLHLGVALIFFIRSPISLKAGWKPVALALPSFVFTGLLFRLSPPTDDWALYIQALFGLGTAFTIYALFYINKNFAVLPAFRALASRGPYRIIRHPMYLGESILLLTCLIAGLNWLALVLFTGAMGAIVIRVLAEEDFLRKTAAYREYCELARWRFLPGVW